MLFILVFIACLTSGGLGERLVLVTFCTEGRPHDQGLNYSGVAEQFKALAAPHVDDVFVHKLSTLDLVRTRHLDVESVDVTLDTSLISACPAPRSLKSHPSLIHACPPAVPRTPGGARTSGPIPLRISTSSRSTPGVRVFHASSSQLHFYKFTLVAQHGKPSAVLTQSSRGHDAADTDATEPRS